jgi:uncharacterized protein
MTKRLIASWLLVLNLFATGPAAAQAPSNEAVAAAKELVVAMRFTDQVKTAFPLIMQQLKPALTQANPLIERDYDALIPLVLGAMDSRMTELVDSTAAIYARFFTADELKQLAAFYRAPVGQKFLQNMGPILQESMAVGQKFGQQMAGELQSRMTEELRKRGHKI